MFNRYEARDDLGYGRKAALGFAKQFGPNHPDSALCADVVRAIDRLGYAVTGDPDPFKAKADAGGHSVGGGRYEREA